MHKEKLPKVHLRSYTLWPSKDVANKVRVKDPEVMGKVSGINVVLYSSSFYLRNCINPIDSFQA